MSADFVAYCLELLAPLGRLRTRRMFGGHGIYADEVFVAFTSAQRLFLKVDEHTRERFAAAGGQPFVYAVKGGERHALGFFTPPEDAMDAPPLMLPWARLALEAALRAKTKRPAARKAARPRAAAPGAEAPPQTQPRARGASAPSPAAQRRKAAVKRPA